MKELFFEKVDEVVYTTVLENGIEVYLYPTDKTKNFYITISVKYGARVTKYKKGNNIFNVIPGSAHFLEHKSIPLSENPVISERINELGSLANAYTNYHGTNYNIFGSINIKENIRLLFDMFYNTDINDKNVEEEKGIIHSEKDRGIDNINRLMYRNLYRNLFEKRYYRNDILGEHEDIDKMTSKDLNRIHEDFYIPNNTFIVVVGNFDKDDIIDEINSYMKNLHLKKRELPIIIEEKEDEKVACPYEEIVNSIDDTKIIYSMKIKRNIFSIDDDDLLSLYLRIVMNNNFSVSSKTLDRYKRDNIVISMSPIVSVLDDFVVINISALVKNSDIFLNNIKKDLKNMSLTEEEFTRKKKGFLKEYIMSFENIEDVEDLISYSLMKYNKISLDEYDKINNSVYKDAIKVMKLINQDNVSIIKTIKG